jgi:hypothetical protein
VAVTEESKADRAKYGRLIGDFTTQKFGVKGTVYAVDKKTLSIKGFSHDTGIETSFYIQIQKRDDFHQAIYTSRPSQR